jgi:glycosyltransferase involved in cell wall biosynthesis
MNPDVRGTRSPVSVSICICTRNRADRLGETLDRILQCRPLSGQTVEVLVIDNGSTDGTQELLSRYRDTPFPMRPLIEPEKGQSRARNKAMRESRCDILLFTDDDVLVPSNWIEGMTSPFANPEIHAVQGRILLHPDLRQPWMEDMHKQFMAEFDRLETETLVGANFAVRRDSLLTLGGFDVEFGPGTQYGFGDDSWTGLQFSKHYGQIHVYRGEPVIHCPEMKRLTRQLLFQRMIQQTDLEVEMIRRLDRPVPPPAMRPVWVNRLLMAAKVAKNRVLHAGSPATEDEICAVRSVRLAQLKDRLVAERAAGDSLPS